MSSTFQTAISLALVAVALGGLVWRAVGSRRRSGGGCSGCPTDSFKEGLAGMPHDKRPKIRAEEKGLRSRQ